MCSTEYRDRPKVAIAYAVNDTTNSRVTGMLLELGLLTLIHN